MNCPVCKKELDFQSPEVEGFYYDCPFCDSSLSFQEGQCEVISKGTISKETISKEAGDPKEEKLDSEDNPSREREFINQDSVDLEQEAEELFEPSSFKTSSTVQKSNKNNSQPVTKQEEPNSNFNQNQLNEDKNNINHAGMTQSSLDENNINQPEDQSGGKQPFETHLEHEEPSSDEVTEIPEMGEEPNEFMEQEESKHKKEQVVQSLPNEFMEQEEVEPLEQDESSFVFEENSEEEEQAKEDFSELVEFSKNKEQKEKGLYLYRLFLSEINSQIFKDKVIALLEDSYLEIDFQEHSSYKEDIIKKGKIVLSNLSPVQVYVILHHLMGLPIKVYWEQSHIADS